MHHLTMKRVCVCSCPCVFGAVCGLTWAVSWFHGAVGQWWDAQWGQMGGAELHRPRLDTQAIG